MWFALSRGSFGLAVLAAGAALLAPGDHAAAYGALTAMAGGFALTTWRKALAQQSHAVPEHGAAPSPEWLGWPALAGAVDRLTAVCADAATFAEALQQAADVLRSETGARRMRATCTPRADAETAATVRSDGAVLPVVVEDAVVGMIELHDIALPIEPAAMRRLLDHGAALLAARARRQTPPDAVAIGSPDTDARRILWVSPDRSGAMAAALGWLGLRVTQITYEEFDDVARGASAETQSDLVLVDVDAGEEGVSPHGTGTPMRGVPRIAVSMRARPEDEKYFVEHGFDGLVCQPYADGRLLAMLSRYAAGPRRQAADEASAGSAPRTMQLDAGALARLADLDPNGENRLLERVLRAYQTSIARLMPQFEEARRTGNHDVMRQVAHTLKSSSASIGAVKFSQLCAEIETMIRSQRTAGLDASADALCGELTFVLEAVKQLLDSRS